MLTMMLDQDFGYSRQMGRQQTYLPLTILCNTQHALCLLSELASLTPRSPSDKIVCGGDECWWGPQCGSVLTAACRRLVHTSCADDLDTEYNLELHYMMACCVWRRSLILRFCSIDEWTMSRLGIWCILQNASNPEPIDKSKRVSFISRSYWNANTSVGWCWEIRYWSQI